MKRGEEAKKKKALASICTSEIDLKYLKREIQTKKKESSDMGTGGSCLCGLLFRT